MEIDEVIVQRESLVRSAFMIGVYDPIKSPSPQLLGNPAVPGFVDD